MEKRLALALALSVAFMLFWAWLFPTPRPPESLPAAGAEASGGAGAAGEAGAPVEAPHGIERPGLAGSGTPSSALRAGAAAAPGGAPQPAERSAILPAGAAGAEVERTVQIDTPLQTILITNRGGRVVSWRLKRYLDDAGEALDLVSPAGKALDHLPMQFLLPDGGATQRLREALYGVERGETDSEEGGTVTTITLTYGDGRGLAAAKVLRVSHASYVSDLEVAALMDGRPVTPTLVWGAGFGRHNGEKSSGSMGYAADAAQGVVSFGGRVERRQEDKVEPASPWIETGTIAWAGLEDKYFAALLLPHSPAPAQTWVESIRHVEDGRERFYLSFALQQPGATRFGLFVGPKDYDILKGSGSGLDRMLDFGFFGVIALPLFYAMKFVDRFTGNFGWAIVILTILIRLVFFPFMHRGQLKMKKMQEKMKRVQPRVKAMRERYHKLERKEMEKGKAGARKQLRLKMNEEMMELYKTEGINPLGSMSGCLPLLLQMPILYGFYTILTISIELRRAPFLLWIRDLSQKDPYYITPIVMGITMLLQQMMTSGSIPDPTQRRIMYIMPVMFTYFFVNLPSGLVLYWLVNNLLGIGQQYLVNREAEAQARSQAA